MAQEALKDNKAAKVGEELTIEYKQVEKAAILLISLPETISTKIVGELDVDEIREVSNAMINLGAIPSGAVETVFIEFMNEFLSIGSVVGSVESTERLLSKILSTDQVDSIMEEIRGPAGRTLWDKLSNVNEDLLANFLKNEYPQTVALVLSRIKPKNASRILALLPEKFAMEVVMRLLNLEIVRKDIMTTVESRLYHEFMSNFARNTKRNTFEMVAEIFNSLDKANELKFLSQIEEINAEQAERIRGLMFTFDDLEKLDNTGIQTVIRFVDKSRLALALKGCKESLKKLFIANMSERAGKLMEDEITQLGKVRLRDVEDAQGDIIDAVKELVEKNTLMISSGKDEGDQLIG